MNALTHIQPLLLDPATLNPQTVDHFEPELRMVMPTDLKVDHRYQRQLTRKSINLIKKIVGSWSWDKFKPPIVVENDTGDLLVIDGQHTSIAAATHPKIAQIPVFVVNHEAALSLQEQATAFIAHNVDRTTVNPIQLFKARVEAGDEDAISIQMALNSAGVRLTNAFQDNAEGTLTCIGALEAVFKRRGLAGLRRVLVVCKRAKLSPIQAHYVQSTDELLHDPKHRGKYDEDGLSLAMKEYPYPQLVADVERYSRERGVNRRLMCTTLMLEHYNRMYGL